VGASRTPGKIGYEVLRNLIEYGYEGAIYPVNPKANEILGVKCYPSLLAIPGEVDVAIISIPAKFVPEVLEEAGKKGVKHVVIITSGFKEIGNVELENKIVEIAKRYGMRILGPNIFGYVYTPAKINATFGPRDVIPGGIAFITQSGALGIALMGMTILKGMGISAIVSVGNKADIEDADLLEFFEKDDNTKVVLIYMEGVVNGRRFVKVAAKTTLRKPVIVIKSGRTEAGAKAAASHTGALAGNVAIYMTAFQQSGVLVAKTVEEAFDWAKAFSWLPLPKGDRLVVITNGGGAGVQTTDTLAENGILLNPPPESLANEIRKFVPPFASLANPIDMTGMATEDMYYKAVRAAMENPEVDSIIILYCHTVITDPVGVASAIIRASKDAGGVTKPVVVSIIGGREAADAIKMLTQNKIPAYPTPERAASAMAAIYKYIKLREQVKLRLQQLEKL